MNPFSNLMAQAVYAVEQEGKIGVAVDSLWSAFAVPLMIIFIVAIIGLLLRVGSKRYLKVPPEKALVIYGRGRTSVVTGGAKFILPVFYDFYWLDLQVFQFDLPLHNIPNKDGVKLSVKAVATCKISSKEDLLSRAAGNFGQSPLKDIQAKIQNALEGHLRVVIGQIDMDTILRKRDEFNQRIQTEAAQEVESLGCEIKILNIQEVSDEHGYIDALGKPKTAEVLAEASIKEAEQKRRQTIETTNANREAEKTKAENEAQIADAQRDLNKKKAQYDAEVSIEQAKAEQAKPLATAEARKAVVTAEVEVEKSKTLAEIDLQEAVGRKTEAELKATVLKQADAEKQRLSTEAEGLKQKAITEAEGLATARKTKASAEREALQAEGEGEAKKTEATGLAKAKVIKEVGLAEAEAEKAKLLARADGTKADRLAVAMGIEAELLAQAKGRKELIDAYANLDSEQRQLFITLSILERLPELTRALGEAGREVMGEITKAVTASLGQIDNLTVYDSSGGDQGGLKRTFKMAPDVIYEVMQLLKATGVAPVVADVAKKLGFDLSSILPVTVGGLQEVDLPSVHVSRKVLDTDGA